MAKFTHHVTLHFRSISLTSVPFAKMLECAQEVYKPYGIEIKFGTGQSLLLSEEETKKYEQIDGSCEWKITSGEYADVQKLGAETSPKGIKVYFVKKFSQANLLGCGGHAPNKPACIVAATSSKWVMAHEVGHVLLTSKFKPVHSSDKKNLMYKSAIPYKSVPILTDKQVEQVKKSPYCVKY